MISASIAVTENMTIVQMVPVVTGLFAPVLDLKQHSCNIRLDHLPSLRQRRQTLIHIFIVCGLFVDRIESSGAQ
jgi:hypothetical protein